MTEAIGKTAAGPFSTPYHLPPNLAWQSLRIFFIYRITLASLFVGLFFLAAGPSLLGKHNPELYAITSSLYLGLLLLGLIPLSLRRPPHPLQAQSQIFLDILALTLIMHSSGGIESGLGILLGVSIAAGGILLGGRYALLFAALASLAILAEQVHADITDAFSTTAYAYAGMLGASFFAIALLAHVLARRAEQSEAVAVQRAIDAANLQQLNEFIIQHLKSGILIVDQNSLIRMLNDSARRLLNLTGERQSLHQAAPMLANLYQNWLAHPQQDSAMLQSGQHSQTQVLFTPLGGGRETLHMIFLEDNALHNQRVQQSKLASLGRLTASIAHELRNPLGAISHASQLLSECPSLSEQDLRLIAIIHAHTVRVNKIIENILQISRRTPSQRKRIALEPWLTRFMLDFQQEHQLADSPFELIIDSADSHSVIDPSHLKQILDNLCSNALKYGNPEGAKIKLQIARSEKDAMPCIEVMDQGPGVSPEILPQIFEPFFTTSSSGTGLGLYIARELAELNQARLEYEALSEGSGCFRICLPDAEKTVIEL